MSGVGRVSNLVSKWRLMDDATLRGRLKREGLSDGAVRVALHRAEKKRKIFRWRESDESLVFDSSWQSRFQFLSDRAEEESGARVLSRSGMRHQVMVSRVGLSLGSILNYDFVPVLLPEVHLRRSKRAASRNLFVPDLIAAPSLQSEKLFYVEIERSMKKLKRYQERWSAYEVDRSVGFCLYVVPSAEMMLRICHVMKSYFERVFMGREDFSLACVLDGEMDSSTLVRRFSSQGEEILFLGDGFGKFLEKKA
jgi:hypothetical protein